MMSYFNPGTFSMHEPLDRIKFKVLWHEPNVSMGVLDRTKHLIIGKSLVFSETKMN